MSDGTHPVTAPAASRFVYPELEIALLSALLRLRQADQARFHAALAALRGRGGAGDQSPILEAVALAEASEAQLKGRLREAGKKVALFETEYRGNMASRLN